MNRRFTASASGLELGRSAYPSYHFVTGNIPVKSEGLHNPETPYQLVSGNLPVRSAQDFPECRSFRTTAVPNGAGNTFPPTVIQCRTTHCTRSYGLFVSLQMLHYKNLRWRRTGC